MRDLGDKWDLSNKIRFVRPPLEGSYHVSSFHLKLVDDGLGKVGGGGGSLDVPRLELAILDDLVDGRGDRVGLLVQTEVSQQHAGGEDHGSCEGRDNASVGYITFAKSHPAEDSQGLATFFPAMSAATCRQPGSKRLSTNNASVSKSGLQLNEV